MDSNKGLYTLADVKDMYLPDKSAPRRFAGVFVYEQIAFMLDEAQAALMRPGAVTCERALKRIAAMAQEIMPLAAKVLTPGELAETREDLAAELKRRCGARKAWCPDKTPIAREIMEEQKGKK